MMREGEGGGAKHQGSLIYLMGRHYLGIRRGALATLVFGTLWDKYSGEEVVLAFLQKGANV